MRQGRRGHRCLTGVIAHYRFLLALAIASVVVFTLRLTD